MPNSNDKPLPTAGEAAPAPVSIPDALVSHLNEQLEMTKLSDQDEAHATVGDQEDKAQPPADAAVGDTNTKEDPDLWKPHPPTEECPVCMIPLHLYYARQMYWVCCGKILCTACCAEHDRALRVINMKREKKKQPLLEKTCAFCRSPVQKNDAGLLMLYDKRIGKDDTAAMLNLAHKCREGLNGLRKNDEKAFKLLNRAARLGSDEAIGQLGTWADTGWPDSNPDRRKAKEYYEDAAKKGHVQSRFNIAILLAEEDNYDIAIKHWHLAAAAGHDNAMNCLWKCFSEGNLSKPDLEKALRANKATCDEMNSEERKRFDAWKNAEAENDEVLKIIYESYYGGYINAKELKAALKAHRAGDLRAVERLLESKYEQIDL